MHGAAVWFVFLTAAGAGPAPADGPRHRAEGTSDAQPILPHPVDSLRWAARFVQVSGVRELPDGRLIVADEGAGLLAALTPGDRRVDTIVRITASVDRDGTPAEVSAGLQRITRPWPVGAAGTVIADRTSRRAIVLDGTTLVGPDGQTARVLTAAARRGAVVGVDALGQPVVRTAPAVVGRDASDSLLLVRLRPVRPEAGGSTGVRVHMDTVARLDGWLTDPPVPRRGVVSFLDTDRVAYRISLEPHDHALAFPDGWVAIARARPYRVDWCRPSGGCRAGPILEDAGSPLTADDRLHLLRWVRMLSGSPPSDDPDDVLDWPRTLPPFVAPPGRLDGVPLFALPDGALLVHRAPAAADGGAAYDRIDRSGTRTERLVLPPGEWIVGVGASSLYAVARDAEGWQVVVRRPL